MKNVVAVKATEKKNHLNYLKYIWILIPAIPYFNMVNIYAVNFPYQDDYNAILEFLCKYKKAEFTDKLALLFSQHGEHRIFFSRIVYVLFYDIMGKINFRSIIFLGNIQLVVMFLLFVYFIKKAIPAYWSIIAFISAFCFFDLSNYENADFAMSGICNYGIIMLFMLSLYFYSLGNKKMLIPAVIIEIIFIFSSGAGMIGAFCLLLFALFNKDKLKIILSAATFIVFVPLYFLHYTKVPAMGEAYTGFGINRIVPFFFHMMGSHFSYDYGVYIGVVTFILLILLLPISLKLKIRENTLPLLCILAFIMGSIVVTSLFRSNISELTSYSSRYLIYGHFLVAMMLVFLFVKLEGKNKIMWPAVVVASLLLLYGYKGNYDYGEEGFAREKQRLERIEYYYGDHTPASAAIAKAIATDACQQEIYCIQDER